MFILFYLQFPPAGYTPSSSTRSAFVCLTPGLLRNRVVVQEQSVMSHPLEGPHVKGTHSEGHFQTTEGSPLVIFVAIPTAWTLTMLFCKSFVISHIAHFQCDVICNNDRVEWI